MSCVSYSCQGLGKARAIVRLTNLVRREDPKIVLLMKTKCERKKMEEVRVRLGFKNYFVVECRGKLSGLDLLWDSSVQLNIKTFTSHHIDVEVVSGDIRVEWRLTYVYG